MHAWKQIQQTVNYIEDHLNEEINIEDLAKTACLSPFYYQRLFSRLVKKPVAEYIKLRRMARAADCLLQSDIRILDIALELGFTSHEYFSRTFKNTFGLTPDEYRKKPQTLNRMTKPQLLLHYTLVDEEVPLITDGIVLEIHRKELKEPVHYMGLIKDVPIHHIDGLGTESGINPLASLWDDFHKQKSALTKALKHLLWMRFIKHSIISITHGFLNTNCRPMPSAWNAMQAIRLIRQIWRSGLEI